MVQSCSSQQSLAELFDCRTEMSRAVQRDIESHNKIVNAVLKLSERLAAQGSEGRAESGGRRSLKVVKEERERDSLQLVAINLQRRWHGIWLHSLEWQCRLEEALTRRKGLYQDGLDFNRYSLSVLDESLFGESSQNVSDQGLIELDDESLLFVGHRADIVDLDESRSRSASPSLHHQEEFALWTPDISDSEDIHATHHSDSELSGKGAYGGSGSGATTPVGLRSPPRPILTGRSIADSPLGKRPYPDQTPGDASPAKRGSQSPLSSSGGASPVSSENPLDNFINSRGLCINKQQFDHGLLAPQILRSSHLLCDRSSGDSANISECESKMGDSPPLSLNLGSPSGAGAGECQDSPGNIPGVVAKTEVKDVGYSSESQSNDEIEMMRHQIDMEYKFPGKCEVATDGPLGDKVMFPQVGVRPDYYCMTHVDMDSTTASDMTDSSGERGGMEPAGDNANTNDSRGLSDSLEDSWGKEGFGKQVFDENNFGEQETSEAFGSDRKDEAADNMIPMHQIADFSESDSAAEGGKKSIRYLIDHAEDLVKPNSPKSPSNSPKKSSAGHASIVLQSTPLAPCKQTQTDTCSTVESSCDASGEDNSDHDQGIAKAQMPGEEFSTATDDADDTLFNSVINMESVSTPDASKIHNFNGFAYPRLSNVYDSARLKKQTGEVSPKQRQRRDKKDRPWSVVGLQEVNCKTEPSIPMPIAASESAINNLHFHTDSDSSPSKSPFLLPSQPSTFPRDHRSSQYPRYSPADHNMSSSRSRRRYKPSDNLSTAKELFRTSEGSTSTIISESKTTARSEGSSGGEQLQRSPPKTRRPRRPRCRSHLEGKEPISNRSSAAAYRSSTTESYDSAEADTESETAEEYLTAPMEVPTSEGDDVHNVSGSLSENSTWDNYQMVYPTASEDANEELLAWEPHDDDLEFDDDFELSRRRSRSIVTDVLTDGQQRRTKLKFTKQGVPCDDSDSDLEDFHHILDQSELQLKLVDQSLRKKRKDPMGSGLHPNPAKYSEILVTYETNMRCLESICQHLNSEDITPEDVKRVKDLMYQWEKVYALASERHSQTTALSGIRDKVIAMKACVEETRELLSFDKFSSADDLHDTIARLKENGETLEKQGQQIEELRQQLTDFSSLHPTICVEKYLKELATVQKSTSSMFNKAKEHVSRLESQRGLWLEYLDGQQELDNLLTTDRDRLHQLLWHRESGLTLTKKDVLTELEVLQASLSVYESKLAVLGAMRAQLTQSSDAEAQQVLLASLADLRNQLLVVSQRCKQMYRDLEDDQDLPLQPLDGLDGLDKDSDFGKLAVSAAALHEAFNQSSPDLGVNEASAAKSPPSPSKTGLSRSCAVVLRSLPVQVVALVLVAGLAYALDPEILDKLASFTLTVTPELNYVNGPPAV
ncbi:A-kinase anchor protein 6 [Elysia marginata]|uniref:A-kinase anchor protein 6 n=1 Tax=Elysia marginata TaxID=1093978 RepID=A0AAV4IYV5_9GAST|nr:A-kinase anchor protein 6 [Elysia marginata]